MSTSIKTVIYPVKNLAAAKHIYQQLIDVEPYKDEEYYVGYMVDGQNIGLDPNGHSKGMTGPVNYWHVDNITDAVAALTAAGAELIQDVTDVGEGRHIARLADTDGNAVGLLQEA